MKTRILFSIAVGALITGFSGRGPTEKVNGALVPDDARHLRPGIAVLISPLSLAEVERFYRSVYGSDPHVRIGLSDDPSFDGLVVRTTNFEEPWSMIAVEEFRAGVRIFVVADTTIFPVFEGVPR
jgi:hypothetical protein